MPTVFDNIETPFLDGEDGNGLKHALKLAKRGDFCVGSQGVAERARIVLLAGEGLTNEEIIKRTELLGISSLALLRRRSR